MTATATAATTAATTARTVAATAATTLLRLQLLLNHESEAARRVQRTKSSGRGDRRLLVVVILRPLATKKASILYIASKALGSLKCIGVDISSMVGINCAHIGRCRDGIYNNSTHPLFPSSIHLRRTSLLEDIAPLLD